MAEEKKDVEQKQATKSIDPVVLEMLEKAHNDGVSTIFSRSEETKACPIGHEGNCCKICFMGPCRLVGKTTVGLCGATKDTVAARNLARMCASGAAAHSDHGRGAASDGGPAHAAPAPPRLPKWFVRNLS